MEEVSNNSAKKGENQNNQVFKVRAGDIPINFREIEKLKGGDLARQIAYKKLYSGFFIFRRHGDEIIGLLQQPGEYTGFSQLSYPVQLQNGQSVIIPGNKHLQRIFKKHNCIGKWIKIIYVGDRWLKSRHKMKIYEVYDYTNKVKRAPMSPAIAEILKKQTA